MFRLNRYHALLTMGLTAILVVMTACAGSNNTRSDDTRYYQASLNKTVKSFEKAVREAKYDIKDHEQIDDATYKILIGKRTSMGEANPQSAEMMVTIQKVEDGKVKVAIDRRGDETGLYSQSYATDHERRIFDKLDPKLEPWTAAKQ